MVTICLHSNPHILVIQAKLQVVPTKKIVSVHNRDRVGGKHGIKETFTTKRIMIF